MSRLTDLSVMVFALFAASVAWMLTLRRAVNFTKRRRWGDAIAAWLILTVCSGMWFVAASLLWVLG